MEYVPRHVLCGCISASGYANVIKFHTEKELIILRDAAQPFEPTRLRKLRTLSYENEKGLLNNGHARRLLSASFY